MSSGPTSRRPLGHGTFGLLRGDVVLIAYEERSPYGGLVDTGLAEVEVLGLEPTQVGDAEDATAIRYLDPATGREGNSTDTEAVLDLVTPSPQFEDGPQEALDRAQDAVDSLGLYGVDWRRRQ